MRTTIAVLLTIAMAGCSRMRFVIDAVPAEDELTETIVLSDDVGWSAPKVAMIDVSGLIVDARRGSFLAQGENPVALFSEALARAEADQRVRAVLLRINSPGGTVTASDLMYRELVEFRERSGKPVIVLMGDVAASGGYYLACGADHIIAHPTTITGSIGVIMQMFDLSGGMAKIGVQAEAITSGPNKAMGSPFAPMPDSQRALLQGIVDEFYGDFLAMVRERRPGISDDRIEQVTDGRVVTGSMAAEVGLVDELGGLRDAFASAKTHAGLEAARLVKYHRPIDYVGSAYAHAQTSPAQINLVHVDLGGLASAGGRAGFYYLWDPTVWQ